MDSLLIKKISDDSKYDNLKKHYLKQICYIKDLNNIIFKYIGYFELKKKLFYYDYFDYVNSCKIDVYHKFNLIDLRLYERLREEIVATEDFVKFYHNRDRPTFYCNQDECYFSMDFHDLTYKHIEDVRKEIRNKRDFNNSFTCLCDRNQLEKLKMHILSNQHYKHFFVKLFKHKNRPFEFV